MGANPAVLPLPFQIKFSKLFDDAPQIPMSVVRSVFFSEFGRPPSGPDGVFEYFDDHAIASASIAQVHRAMLWEKDEHGRDQWVAVKIQKPDVGKQVEWDLSAYKFVSWMFEHWVFDLPIYFVCGRFILFGHFDVVQLLMLLRLIEFVSDHLRRELDFIQEASNALETSKHVASEPYLASKVYIPKLYPQHSTKKIMTAEWIDGVRLTDKPALRRLMGIDPGHKDPLRGGFKAIMEIMITLFSAQIFSFGWVHCDPHPGNIIIRPNPSAPRTPQLVLLDHGLYVRLSENFRRQYAVLWKSLLTLDWKAIELLAGEWGIGTPDLFASAVLLRPVNYDGENGAKKRVRGGGNKNKEEGVEEISEYEQSMRLKAKLKNFLIDTDKMPKELIFLGRNMRCV
jgi:aarF domain-containing kinase